MAIDLNDLIKKANEYAAAQLEQWLIGPDDPRHAILYPAIFESHLVYLIDHMDTESVVTLLNVSGMFPARIACSNSALAIETEPTREELVTLLDDILKHIYLSGPEISTELQARIEDALIRPEMN